MKKKDLITLLFPTGFMLFTLVLSLMNFLSFTSINFKGAFVINVVLLFPLLFFAQGIYSSINKVNPLVSFSISMFTYIVLACVFLNSSALEYILYYTASFTCGYLAQKISVRIKKNKKNT